MKILLSAYACEPNKGSEPGVGWNWALALARRGYQVHVMTRSNNREVIEKEKDRSGLTICFHYYDLPAWARFWKHWPAGIYIYYLLWQVGAYRMAARLHAHERFELVQHITFVSYRQPSFMGGLGIPFVFGPVGGGETMPRQLRRSIQAHARIAEFLRDAGNRFVAIDPLMRKTYSAAQVIVCATEETLTAIPAQFRSKCIVQRAIGIDDAQIANIPNSFAKTALPAKQLLFVGRLLYWKGLQFALRAMEHVKDRLPDIRLRVIGQGPDRDWLMNVAESANVAERVEWIPTVAFEEMWKEYRACVGLVFPSLHDSGGMVVLEAMANSIPVICLDLGGPGSMVNSTCGMALPTYQRSESQIVEELAGLIVRLISDSEMQRRLAEGARKRAHELSWDAAAEAVYSALPRVQLPISN